MSLGYAKLVYGRDSSGAQREFQRALDLRPDYATAPQYYAYYLTTTGRLQDAIAERNPASLWLNFAAVKEAGGIS